MIKYLTTIEESTWFEGVFAFNYGCLVTNNNDVNTIIMCYHCAYTHMHIQCVSKKKRLHTQKAMAVVTGSHPHAVVLLKGPTLIICAQVDLAGRTQGPRPMSVAMVRKLLPLPGTTYLGTIPSPPQHR